MRADTVEVTGVTGSQAARARITQILSDKLGQGQTFQVDVSYDEELDPLAALPTPEECAADVNGGDLRGTKITFTPGFGRNRRRRARPVMDELADDPEGLPGRCRWKLPATPMPKARKAATRR